MREAFAVQKFLTIFQQKYWRISDMNILNFNDTLTNDIVSFEQPGPGLFWLFPVIKSVPVKFTHPFLAVTLIFCSDVLLD